MEDDGRRNYHLVKSNPHALCYYYRRRGIPHSKSKKTIDPSKQSRQPGQMDQSMKGTKNKERRARGRPGGSAGTWSWCRRGTRAARGRRRWRRPWARAGLRRRRRRRAARRSRRPWPPARPPARLRSLGSGRGVRWTDVRREAGAARGGRRFVAGERTEGGGAPRIPGVPGL